MKKAIVLLALLFVLPFFLMSCGSSGNPQSNVARAQKYVTTRSGLSLWLESFGNAVNQPVLLISGAMTQAIMWPDSFCENFAKAGFYVVRFDNRDTGLSSKINYATNPYTLENMADDAYDVIKSYSSQAPIVMGVSLGGELAQLIGIRYPTYPKKLILADTSPDQRPYMAATNNPFVDIDPTLYVLPGPTRVFLDNLVMQYTYTGPFDEDSIVNLIVSNWESIYAGARAFPRTQVEAFVRLQRQRQLDNPYSQYNHGPASMASPDRLESVKTITKPTLVIHGTLDPCFPLAHGQYLAANIPGAELVTFAFGHGWMWQWDDDVLAVVLNFVVQ